MDPAHDAWNIPFDSPFYPRLPARYEDVLFQFVFFRADISSTELRSRQ